MRRRSGRKLALLAATAALLLVPSEAHATRVITAHHGRLWRGSEAFHVYGYNYGPQSWRWLCNCMRPTRGSAPPTVRTWMIRRLAA